MTRDDGSPCGRKGPISGARELVEQPGKPRTIVRKYRVLIKAEDKL